MRALCAAIVTAGALIGLGLASIGIGARYQSVGLIANDYVHWKQLDTPLMLILVTLVAALLAGLAATFLGLAYHHERRHYERHGQVGATKAGVNLRD